MQEKEKITKKLNKLRKTLKFEEESDKKELDLEYITSQIQILEYILSKESNKDSIEKELLALYDKSLEKCTILQENDKLCTIDENKMIAAADILSWVLKIPKKAHKKNKRAGAVLRVR